MKDAFLALCEVALEQKRHEQRLKEAIDNSRIRVLGTFSDGLSVVGLIGSGLELKKSPVPEYEGRYYNTQYKYTVEGVTFTELGNEPPYTEEVNERGELG